jgi:hypothetical protein
MCCNTGGSYAGGSCGGGTLDDLDQSSSVVTRWGNVDIGEYHWYKFRAVQDDTTTSSARMSTWVWLSVNPGNAFRFEVRRTPAGVSDCSSPTSECGLSEYFDWFLSGGLEYTSNESKVFYIGVTRTDPASAGHECDPYELSIKVGGSAAPW